MTVTPKIANRKLQNLHINFDEQDLKLIRHAFEADSFSGKSPIISDYEAVISHYFDVPHALACCNGTVAIELALKGLGLTSGAKVGLPPTAPIMTILPILNCGLEPVFYDVAPDSFGPDLDDLTVLLVDGLDAIITVPMWGYPWDMEPLVRFCKSHNILLIEDCAHSFGTHMNGRKFGSFGDAAAFSTHERKLVSTGEGGFCLTPHKDVRTRMRTWQHHGAKTKDGAEFLGAALGTNYKLSPICAALGISQFGKLDAKIQQRQMTVAKLRDKLKAVHTLREFKRFPGSEINGYAMVYWYVGETTAETRATELGERGIQSDTVRYKYKPLYKEKAFRNYRRPCPNAERLISSIITLPCHEGLNDTDVHDIVNITGDVFCNRHQIGKVA
ncbi:MAG: DegT/DnrJ/EryC1/StrS family aminotransferase [Paracoccaceae bacterium]